MGRAILLTGNPGCGKTTLIRRILPGLPKPVGGFYTQELREVAGPGLQGNRLGFEIVTLDGQKGTLAHVDIRGPQRIGKYGVDIGTLDRLAVTAIQNALAANGIVVIDEIGPMEMLSGHFRQAVLNALNCLQPSISRPAILGTLVKRSTPFTDQVKALPMVTVIEVRLDNRIHLPEIILKMLLDK
jgi:nucleoside-triphosphatase